MLSTILLWGLLTRTCNQYRSNLNECPSSPSAKALESGLCPVSDRQLPQVMRWAYVPTPGKSCGALCDPICPLFLALNKTGLKSHVRTIREAELHSSTHYSPHSCGHKEAKLPELSRVPIYKVHDRCFCLLLDSQCMGMVFAYPHPPSHPPRHLDPPTGAHPPVM